MQPGNNYRVVASVVDQSMITGVQVTTSTAAKYLGPAFAQNAGVSASLLLTVWRRLWVENDSMAAIPVDPFGYKRNDISWNLSVPTVRNVLFDSAAATTSFVIDAITDQSSFSNPENGRMIVQSIIHPVVSTAPFSVTVAGNHSSVPVNSEFRLYDDDEFGLDVPSLPRTDLVNQQMKNYFKPAFIEVTDLGGFNLDKHVPFLPTEDVFSIFTTLDDKKEPNVLDRNPLWVCHLIAAYQGPMDADLDPSLSDESVRSGETAAHGGSDHSAVYVECCRETFNNALRANNPDLARILLNKWITAVASHEMGHQPGTHTPSEDHAEDLLMSDGLGAVSSLAPENSKFSPKTIRRFRISNRWSE